MGTFRPTIGHHRPLLTVGSRLGLSRLRRYSQFGVLPIHRSSLPLIARQRSLSTPTPLIPPRRSLTSVEQFSLRPPLKRSPQPRRAVTVPPIASVERFPMQEAGFDWSVQSELAFSSELTPEFIPEYPSAETVPSTPNHSSVLEPSTLSSTQTASLASNSTPDTVVQSPQPFESPTIGRQTDALPIQATVQQIGALPVGGSPMRELENKRPADSSQKKASRKQATKSPSTQSGAAQNTPSKTPKRRRRAAAADAVQRSHQVETPSLPNIAESPPEVPPRVAPVVNTPDAFSPAVVNTPAASSPQPEKAADGSPDPSGSLPTMPSIGAPDGSAVQPFPPIEVARAVFPVQEDVTLSEAAPAVDVPRSEAVGAVLHDPPALPQPLVVRQTEPAAPKSASPKETGIPTVKPPMQRKKVDARQKRSPKSSKKPSTKPIDPSAQRSPNASPPASPPLSNNRFSNQLPQFSPESSPQPLPFSSPSPGSSEDGRHQTESMPLVQPAVHTPEVEASPTAFEPDLSALESVQFVPSVSSGSEVKMDAEREGAIALPVPAAPSETAAQQPTRPSAVPRSPMISPEQSLESVSTPILSPIQESPILEAPTIGSKTHPLDSSLTDLKNSETPGNQESELSQKPFQSLPAPPSEGEIPPAPFPPPSPTPAESSPSLSDNSSPLLQGYSVGGTVIQRQTPTGKAIAPSDTVPAMLTPGEFVVNAQDAQKHLPLLHHLNRGGNLENAPVPSVEPAIGEMVPTQEPPPAIARKPKNLQRQRQGSPIQRSLSQIAGVESDAVPASPSGFVPFQVQTSETAPSEPATYTPPTMIHRSSRSSSPPSGDASGVSSSSLPEQWNSVEDLLGMQTRFGTTGGSSAPATAAPAVETPAIVHRQVAVQGFAEGGEVASPSPTAEAPATETVTAEGQGEGKEGGKEKGEEMERLAQEIYARLRLRLEIERERQGMYSGRLPW